jgi:hypothetical protein
MRKKIIQVSMKREEKEFINNASAEAGLPPSSFMRFIVLQYIKQQGGVIQTQAS